MIIKLILLLLFPLYLFPQNLGDKVIDSLRTEQKYDFLLTNKLDILIPLHSLGEIVNPYDVPFETEFFHNNIISLSQLNSVTMNRIKTDFNRSFSIYRLGQNKYHLGVVSDVLGYVNAAAVAGITAYHLYKYRKKYGFK